jgi:hypothetical protein
MKSFPLTSSIELQRLFEQEFISSVGMLTFKSVGLTSRQDRGGISYRSLCSSVYDSSREVGLSSSFVKGKLAVYGLSSKLKKLQSIVNVSFSSKVQVNTFTEFRLTSGVTTQKRISMGLKSSVFKSRYTHHVIKSFIYKKNFVSVPLSSGVSYLFERDAISIGLRSAYLNYVSPLSIQKLVFESVRSIPMRVKVLTVGAEGSRSIGIGVYENMTPFREEVKSLSLNFKKEPTLSLSSVQHHLCKLSVSCRRDLEELRAFGLGVIGVFGVLGGVRSNSIQVSIYRDIIDFQEEEATALRFGMLASTLDLSDKSIHMKIDFGSGLCFLRSSRYRKIMNPFVPKVEDDTIFRTQKSIQRISVSNKSALFDLSMSAQLGVNTTIAEENKPWLSNASLMLNIVLGRQSIKMIRLRPNSGVVAIVTTTSLVESTISNVLGKNLMDKALSGGECYASVGEWNNMSAFRDDIFFISSSSAMINTGVFASIFLPGTAYTREVFILDDNGNVIGTEILESRQVPLLQETRGMINLVSIEAIAVLEGFRMSILMQSTVAIIVPFLYFEGKLGLHMRAWQDFSSIRSLQNRLTAVFTQNFGEVRSNSQYLSANMMFTLPPISGTLSLKVN